jgi:putative ABC transport system permease protein
MLDEGAFSNIKLKDGTYTAIGFVPIGDGVLELFDLKPLAGRFFSESRSDDSQSPSRVVLNETAVKRFGYRSANAALGPAPVAAGDDMDVVGVVKDFTLRSIERPIGPVAYRYTPQRLDVVDVKLNGRSIPEALASIDAVTARVAGGEAPKRYFLDDYIQSLYLATLREAKAFAALSGIAVALACLGLIGLSASATDRRAKEIGIRKALGAETMDVVRLMVWQFTQPVLWAGFIAIPLSAYVMGRWLNGFAYRIELTPWPFVASAAAALAIALITVGVHCYSVARAKPVNALRYE